MTERLYYEDPYLSEFDASVVEARATPEGRRAIVLDRTAFYPTSGGQPFDTGTIGASRVVDVVEDDEGRILHVIDGEPGGAEVRGIVDWPRRFEHMQQHTGQHVLSAAFDRLLGVRTVSFHLGSATSTIDLERGLSPGEILGAEEQANRVVWEDRPVTIRFADAADAAQLPLRKESSRGGRLRLIDIQDFDLSACGGTHVARTGAIGVILVAASERLRGGTRIEFVCGGRALRAYRHLRDVVAASVRQLSVLPAELPEAIERLQLESRNQRRQLKELQSQVALQRAAELAAGGESIGRVNLVAAALDGWDASGLKTVAAAIVQHPDYVAVLAAGPPPCQIVIARSPNISLDCAVVLRSVTGALGGKGGGRPELAQGGGVTASVDEVLALARNSVQAAF